MSAEYILEQRILGPRARVEISEERYRALAHAREILSEALNFEQRYELLLGNFISLELALTEICLRAKIEPKYEYSDSARILETTNRHLVNLLTAMRGYADQVLQDFKCLSLEPAFGEVAKIELSNVFDRSSDYRFMCALRNHVQHKATAIHGFSGALGGDEDACGWTEIIKFFLVKSTLRADKNFKVRVLDEQPEKIDIRRCARRSLQHLGTAHLALRGTIEGRVKSAREIIELAIQEYKDAGAESVIGLGARRVGDKDADVPLLLDWDDVRVNLVNKNDSPPKFWPLGNYRNPEAAKITELREVAGQTVAQAAKLVFVSEERWKDYEDGLPMSEGLFNLYQLQIGRHATHRLHPIGSDMVPDAEIDMDN